MEGAVHMKNSEQSGIFPLCSPSSISIIFAVKMPPRSYILFLIGLGKPTPYTGAM
jgi:hypothetical protein